LSCGSKIGDATTASTPCKLSEVDGVADDWK
jgi:hypothetical protein